MLSLLLDYTSLGECGFDYQMNGSLKGLVSPTVMSFSLFSSMFLSTNSTLQHNTQKYCSVLSDQILNNSANDLLLSTVIESLFRTFQALCNTLERK